MVYQFYFYLRILNSQDQSKFDILLLSLFQDFSLFLHFAELSQPYFYPGIIPHLLNLLMYFPSCHLKLCLYRHFLFLIIYLVPNPLQHDILSMLNYFFSKCSLLLKSILFLFLLKKILRLLYCLCLTRMKLICWILMIDIFQ